MLAAVKSCNLVGLEGQIITVEVDVSPGFPAFDIVGLASPAVREARERVRSAIKNSGFTFPLQRITVNLAPADMRKEGSHFDLAIAVGILSASKEVKPLAAVENYIFIGELSLDGTAKKVPGVLSMALAARKQSSGLSFCVPEANAEEAALTEIEVYPVQTLIKIIKQLKGDISFSRFYNSNYYFNKKVETKKPDKFGIKGQSHALRALEISAAGNHNLMLIGPPGSGKSLLAKTLPLLMPPLTFEECLEVTKIYSIAGLLSKDQPIKLERPFRAPHHGITETALVGGGHNPKPGEIALASKGVLFLDEFAQFNRSIIEALRQPLEEKTVTVSRSFASITYPADFLLVVALNPCPCGFLGDESRKCICSNSQIYRYWSRFSGPLVDRIDLFVEVPRVNYEDIEKPVQYDLFKAQKRINNALVTQKERQSRSNFQLTRQEIETYCVLDNVSKNLLKTAYQNLNLTMRSYDKILKISRTIADLEGISHIQDKHVAEALHYRNFNGSDMFRRN